MQTVNRQSGHGVGFVRHRRAGDHIAAQPVLRRKQRYQIDFVFQDVHRAAKLAVNACRVGNQTDPLAFEQLQRTVDILNPQANDRRCGLFVKLAALPRQINQGNKGDEQGGDRQQQQLNKGRELPARPPCPPKPR